MSAAEDISKIVSDYVTEEIRSLSGEIVERIRENVLSGKRNDGSIIGKYKDNYNVGKYFEDIPDYMKEMSYEEYKNEVYGSPNPSKPYGLVNLHFTGKFLDGMKVEIKDNGSVCMEFSDSFKFNALERKYRISKHAFALSNEDKDFVVNQIRKEVFEQVKREIKNRIARVKGRRR